MIDSFITISAIAMTNIVFEKSTKLDEQYQEYWAARQLARDLDYAE